jgi:hypothetical protein
MTGLHGLSFGIEYIVASRLDAHWLAEAPVILCILDRSYIDGVDSE